MGLHITNRDGTTVDFCRDKIVDAIAKASIRAEEKKVEKEIRAIDLFSGIGGIGRTSRIGDTYLEALEYDDISDAVVELLSESVRTDLEEAFENALAENDDEALLKSYEQYKDIVKTLDEYKDICIACFLQLRRERLEKRRKELRELRKLKTARVSALLKAAWLNRNSSVGRSNTSAVTDLMLISLPVPPTSVTANCSLRYGGAVIATK